jgi:hypothetical protein
VQNYLSITQSRDLKFTAYANLLLTKLISSEMTVFWDAAACSLVEIHQSFGGAYYRHHQGDEDSPVKSYQTTRRNIPEDSHVHTCRRENLTSHGITIDMAMMFFRIFTPCELVGRGRENGDSIFLRNVGIYLRVYTASKPRRATSSSSPP